MIRPYSMRTVRCLMSTVRTLMVLILGLGAASCGSDSSGPEVPDIATTTFAPSLGIDLDAMTITGSGLYWRDVTVGTGTTVTVGSQVGVSYTGWLVNGSQFDSNVGGAPFGFRVGLGQVVPGFDEGVRGMAVGGVRQLIIPPSLGYGASGSSSGTIPPNAILVFRVQLLSVQ